MRADADLGQLGQATILAEFLDRLELSDDVTLVMNDWGGPQFLVHLGLDHRIGRLAIVSCEAFDNFPPAPARPLINLLTLPGGSWLVSRLLRTHLARHHPRALGGLTSAGVPDEVMDDWFAPALANPEIRRDMVKFAKGAATLVPEDQPEALAGVLRKFLEETS